MSGYESFAAFYDELTGNVDYEARGAYLHGLLCREGKSSGILLDLACGTGTLCEYFAARGYEVIGIDASEEMLSEALEKKMDSQSSVLYLCQRMQDRDLCGTVDLVLCSLDSLNHITDADELARVFERISLFLNEDARVIFDVNTVYKHEQVLANNTFVYDLDDVYCVWQNQLRENHTVDLSLDLFAYDEENDCYDRTQEFFSERAYSAEELRGMIEAAGFEILARYAENSLQPPAADTQRVVYLLKNKRCKNQAPQTMK